MTRLATLRSFAATAATFVIGVGLFFAAWEALIWLASPPSYFLPRPGPVLTRIAEDWRALGEGAWITGYEVVLGFLLALVLGFAAALLLDASERISAALWPILLFLQITPQIAIAPFLILWFGVDLMPKLILIVLIAFFPIVVNSYVGLRSIDAETEELARAMRAGRVRYFLRFRLPHSLPYVFTGGKIGVTYAVIGAVVAEFISATGGLGNMILIANGFLDGELATASLVVLSTLGVFLYALVGFIERLVLPWHVSQRRRVDPRKAR